MLEVYAERAGDLCCACWMFVPNVLVVVLCLTEVANSVRCVLWVMPCMLFYVLFGVLLCMMLRILEAVEGKLRSLDVLE